MKRRFGQGQRSGLVDGFGFVSEREIREADLFFADLVGGPRPWRSFAEAESAAEDATEDQVRTDVRNRAIDRARTGNTFLTQADVTTAVGASAAPAITALLDAAVARAVPLRRAANAGVPASAQQTADLAGYWTLVDVGAQRVLDALERDRFRCTSASALLVDGDVVDGMRATWTRSGEALQLDGLCRAAPTRCPTTHAGLHTPAGATGSLAAHFTNLDLGQIRTVQIAGLFGTDVRTTPSARRKDTAVKDFPTNAPLQRVSFVAIRKGGRRDVHVAREAPRKVESWVDDRQWSCLPFMPGMEPGTGYRLFKRAFWEASLTRQWGTMETIAWIVGLATFYHDRTGELLGVGDVSHVVGEDITDHHSHRVGKDLDCYVLDAPPPGSRFPGAFFCSGTAAALELRDLGTPRATDARPEYAIPSGGTAIADPRRATLFDRYATILAYCVATQGLLSAAVWHGAPGMRARAVTLAQAAWDATVTARAGTTARPGWRASWGPGPADRAAIVAPPGGLFVGAGSGSYDSGPGGWPLHQDHLHIRLQ